MGRMIAGVIVGYLSMAAFIFVSFTAAYLALGDDGSFKPGTYDPSTTWLVVSTILGVIGAITAGVVCHLLSARRIKAAYVLAGIVLVLGVVLAIPALGKEDPGPRGPEVTSMQAMMQARTPVWVMFTNPVIGAVGVILGARLIGGGKGRAASPAF